jgi:hypothetical protein
VALPVVRVPGVLRLVCRAVMEPLASRTAQVAWALLAARAAQRADRVVGGASHRAARAAPEARAVAAVLEARVGLVVPAAPATLAGLGAPLVGRKVERPQVSLQAA